MTKIQNNIVRNVVEKDTKELYKRDEIVNDGNIYLGLSCGKTLSAELQDEVRKNLIGAFVALSKYARMFESDGVDEELKALEDSLYERFLEYLRK